MSDDEKSNAGSEVQKSEEEDVPEALIVTKDQLTKGLSRIERTHGKYRVKVIFQKKHNSHDTFSNCSDGSSYAFAALTLEETDPPVTDMGMELQNYEHIQHLNLRKNSLAEIDSMAFLTHLLTVNVSENRIASIKFLSELQDSDKLQFLQVSYSFTKQFVTVLSFFSVSI